MRLLCGALPCNCHTCHMPCHTPSPHTTRRQRLWGLEFVYDSRQKSRHRKINAPYMCVRARVQCLLFSQCRGPPGPQKGNYTHEEPRHAGEGQAMLLAGGHPAVVHDDGRRVAPPAHPVRKPASHTWRPEALRARKSPGLREAGKEQGHTGRCWSGAGGCTGGPRRSHRTGSPTSASAARTVRGQRSISKNAVD